MPVVPLNRAAQVTESPERNRLLAALPSQEYARLLACVQPVDLKTGQQLAFPERPFERVYFPRGAVVSMLVLMEDNKTVEGAVIGNEGIVGLEIFLGDGLARNILLVQIGGEAVSMPAMTFRTVVGGSLPLQVLLQRYSLALMNQMVRTAACNRMHQVNERCARWLLMSRDRVGRDDFPLTHDFLARMLGVRRASVSEAAESLQRSGLIRYRQGRLQIVNGRGLEAAACEDYRLSKAGYDQMY
jgi:CRP-like cAMP-binding protein